jgi:hypothetical protein
MIGNDSGMNLMSNPSSILEACRPDQQARGKDTIVVNEMFALT